MPTFKITVNEAGVTHEELVEILTGEAEAYFDEEDISVELMSDEDANLEQDDATE
jgi:hypothetical protein